MNDSIPTTPAGALRVLAATWAPDAPPTDGQALDAALNLTATLGAGLEIVTAEIATFLEHAKGDPVPVERWRLERWAQLLGGAK